MLIRLLSLALLAALPALVAAESPPAGPPPAYVMRNALQWMQSSDPKRRQAAYRSVHLLGKEALPAFEKALRTALRYHEKRLSKTLNDRHNRNNPYAELIAVDEELKTERARVLGLIRTDWKKDPDKVRMLQGELETVERLFKGATRLAGADTAPIDAKIDSIAGVLVEMNDELVRFDPSPDPAPPEPVSQKRKHEALKETFDGNAYLQAARSLEILRNEIRQFDSADRDNSDCRWARPAQQEFAALLNSRRAVLGLGPLRLDERLSAAATGHSKDMKSLGFFSHTSPVNGKQSPSDRARKAGYQGGWSGENIFAGSASPLGAFNGWFGSDGHRFIMFASGPNVIGVGPVGSHWTLMTGKK